MRRGYGQCDTRSGRANVERAMIDGYSFQGAGRNSLVDGKENQVGALYNFRKGTHRDTQFPVSHNGLDPTRRDRVF